MPDSMREKLGLGDRIGRIVLGSTVVTEFPGDLHFSVNTGMHVLAGSKSFLMHWEK